MTIQQINLGTAPSGAGGDTQRAANEKINQNFGNQAHAASRLVGVRNTDIPSGADILESIVSSAKLAPLSANTTPEPFIGHTTVYIPSTDDKPPYGGAYWTVLALRVDETGMRYEAISRTSPEIKAFRGLKNGVFTPWHYYYSTANTTKDVATGFLKASSPVLHVYNDKITKIHEAEQLDITVDKKGVGHYEIHGTTGLRKNDGWFMSPPRDVHGNVLCMVDVTEKDGVVILKTYKKKFDFETVSIVHDWDNPIDIPDGACVEFRFNDLPQEQLDEPIE